MSNNRSDNELTVKIKSSEGVWETSFPKTAKVSEVIEAVRQHFGYAQNGTYELHLENGEIMEKERPLVSYGVKDGDSLTFSDLGVAV